MPRLLAFLAASEPPPYLALWVVVGFLVAFPLFWSGLVWLIGQLGAWGKLAKKYAAGSRIVSGARKSGQSARMGLSNYSGVLTFHFTRAGFFLEVMPLFRPGHPRLFIPWSAVKKRETKKRLFWSFDVLEVGDPVLATMTVSSSLLAGHIRADKNTG